MCLKIKIKGIDIVKTYLSGKSYLINFKFPCRVHIIFTYCQWKNILTDLALSNLILQWFHIPTPELMVSFKQYLQPFTGLWVNPHLKTVRNFKINSHQLKAIAKRCTDIMLYKMRWQLKIAVIFTVLFLLLQLLGKHYIEPQEIRLVERNVNIYIF